MNKETAAKILILINKTYKDKITDAIYSKYAVKTDILAEATKYGGNDYYLISVKDQGSDVNDKMRGYKLLRNMFKEATLIGDVYYFEGERIVSIMFRITYKQCNGGGNGMELGNLIVNTETGITEWREF